MAWTFEDFPLEMKDLTPQVREKAIEIANKLMVEKCLDEKEAIREAIEQAEEWFLDMEG